MAISKEQAWAGEFYDIGGSLLHVESEGLALPAVGDGLTDDGPALIAANALAAVDGGTLGLRPGRTYLIGEDVEFSRNVLVNFPAGAKFWIDEYATVTMNQPQASPTQHIFDGPGQVILRRCSGASPFWFGAVDDGATDTVDAFNALAAAVGVGGDIKVPPPETSYRFLTGPWLIDKAFVKVVLEGDPCIDATGLTGPAIVVDAFGVNLSRPSLVGSDTGETGIEYTSLAGRNHLEHPKISGFVNGVKGDAIGITISNPEITENDYGIRVQRHSVAIEYGLVSGNRIHNVWFEGDGSRGFSNQNHILGTRIDLPAGGAAVIGTGNANYNHIYFPNIEGGAGNATQHAVDKTGSIGWGFVGGHYASAFAHLAGLTNSDFVLPGYHGNAVVSATGLGNILCYDENSQGNIQFQVSNLQLIHSAISVAANEAAWNVGSGSFVPVTATGVHQIRGIIGNAPGRLIVFANVGSNALQICHEHTTPTTTRRIITPNGASYAFVPGDVAIAVYDNSTGVQRWRWIPVVSNSRARSVAAPAQITANQNDYNPSLLSDWELTSDATRDITGIATGLISPAGHERSITNMNALGSGFDLVLKHEVTSTAANRFSFPAATDVTIPPRGTVTLRYSASATRWILVSKNF